MIADTITSGNNNISQDIAVDNGLKSIDNNETEIISEELVLSTDDNKVPVFNDGDIDIDVDDDSPGHVVCAGPFLRFWILRMHSLLLPIFGLGISHINVNPWPGLPSSSVHHPGVIIETHTSDYFQEGHTFMH